VREVCVFDVNETLLDLGAMDPHFERIFGAAQVRRHWFSQLLQSALVSTVTGVYVDFGRIAMAALDMTAERTGVRLADADRDAVREQMIHLPAHPDVPGALRRSRTAASAWPRSPTRRWRSPRRSSPMPGSSSGSSGCCRPTRCGG